MRTLNTNVKNTTKYSKFSMPGFRSGSIIKKFFALLYYCIAAYYMISMTATYVKGDFSGAGDVFTLILTELFVLAVFLTPVIAIGFSNYYDWHGIKLFMIIMIPICIFSTLANFMSTMFSMEYMYSVNPALKQNAPIEENIDGVVEDDIEEDDEESSDSAAGSYAESVVDSAVDEADNN